MVHQHKMSNEDEVESLVESLPDTSKKSGLNENEIKTLSEAITSMERLGEEPPREPECQFNELFTSVVVTKYDGEVLNGLFHGFGKAEIRGGHYYEGTFQNGFMHGAGMYIWSDGLKYEGDFVLNAMTGKGRFTWLDGSIYEGDVVNSVRHGYGTFYHCSRATKYEGQWCSGKQQGKGKMTFFVEGLSYYEGEWVSNVKYGWGVRVYRSGNTYEGDWKDNLRHGYGTMSWVSLGEKYTGQWRCGMQNGEGEHIWYIKRSCASFYGRRNFYRGCFKDGKRHGWGVFHYANGSKYEGQWSANLKCGQGKLVLENGVICEGEFLNNRMLEPSNSSSDVCEENNSQEKTRTPQTKEFTQDPLNFTLKIHHLLKDYPFGTKEDDYREVVHVILRYSMFLRAIYGYYCRLGLGECKSVDNVLVLSQFQFSRLLKDVKLQNNNKLGLPAYDRMTGVQMEPLGGIHPNKEICFAEFLTSLIKIAHCLFSEEFRCTYVLASCFNKLLLCHLLKFSCHVNGYFFHTPLRTQLVMQNIESLFRVYQSFCCIMNEGLQNCKDSITMRQFLLILKNLSLIDDTLSTANIIEVLSFDDEKVSCEKDVFSLEYEMGFYDFIEAIVGCCLMKSCPVCMSNITLEDIEQCPMKNFSLVKILSDEEEEEEEEIAEKEQLKTDIGKSKVEKGKMGPHGDGDGGNDGDASKDVEEETEERPGVTVTCLGCREGSFLTRFQAFVLHDFLHAAQIYVQNAN